MEIEKSNREKIIEDRRKTRRIRYSAVIGFLIDGKKHQEPNYGITVDISSLGIGFYTPVALEKGDRITIQSYSFKLPSEKAVVVWKKTMNGDLYMVGLEYIPKSEGAV